MGKEQPESCDRGDARHAGAPPQWGGNVFCQAEPCREKTDVAHRHDEKGAQDVLVLVDVRGSRPGQHESHAGTGEQQTSHGSGRASAPQDTTGQGGANNEQRSQE